MPRLGTTVMRIAPVSIVTSMTPSCRPPCRVLTVTEKGLSVLMPSCLLVMVRGWAGVFASSSVYSRAEAGVASRAAEMPRAMAEAEAGVFMVHSLVVDGMRGCIRCQHILRMTKIMSCTKTDQASHVCRWLTVSAG